MMTELVSPTSLRTVISYNDMKKVIVRPGDAEDLVEFLDIFENFLEDFKENVKPSWHLDNNGIGAYECHGVKGFDRGTDFIEIEGNEEEVVLHFLFDITKASTEEILLLLKTCAEHAAAQQTTVYDGIASPRDINDISCQARIGSKWTVVFDSDNFKDTLGNMYAATMELFWENKE